ncbi:hypothetical protein PCASD_16768 [Puccinia coronata f. sp. avenae]|uniref:No apical meristem-associated C-terminal domain-containing protein n=1 Tax=Puccinia coronata f. sp. avenae TaxID=200324 RepID=A0A2N5TE13_9BASI|nr:hypothetical protein PCASD_16768 [Puccinia coronata f. sp. avenae]
MANTTTPAPSANASKKRSRNFGPEEDKQLAKSWLLISTDPIQSNNQSKEQFWSNVVDDFNMFTGGPSREASGLQSRWKTLQREVLKFCAIHNWIKDKPPSGSTPEDWLISARQLYFEDTTKSFAYERPWTLLRNAAKFKPPDQTQAINGRPPSATPSNNTIPDSSTVPGGARSNEPNRWERPLGTHSTKRKLNEEEYKNKKMKLLQTSVKEASKRSKEAKRANDIQDKLVAIDREKMDINLMFINANDCPDNLSCKYLQARKERIIQKLRDGEIEPSSVTRHTSSSCPPTSEPNHNNHSDEEEEEGQDEEEDDGDDEFDQSAHDEELQLATQDNMTVVDPALN